MNLDRLACEAAACRRCPAVVPGSAVVDKRKRVPAGGVLFVGEAPGRLGAARTGVPLSGDVTGDRFERLLREAGLERDAVAVTNAVLCLPLDGRGRNRRPAGREIVACSGFLAEMIAGVRPGLVVALGGAALAALGHIERHGLTPVTGVGRFMPWHGIVLTALYHPGARSAVHRPWERQIEDWRRLGEALAFEGNPGNWQQIDAGLLTGPHRISTMAS